MVAILLSTVLATALSAPVEFVQLPTDVSAFARGSQAVGFDPAASGRADGFELQGRWRSAIDAGSGFGALGIYGVVPWQRIALTGGLEWGHIPAPSNNRWTLGLAFKLADWAWAGFHYRRIRPAGHTTNTGMWDLGVLLEPAPWLSIDFGVDALNAPTGPGVHVARAARAGIAIRPWRGLPYVTLAADTRLSGGYNADWTLPDNRFLLDIAPIEGLHLTGSFLRRGDMHEVWATLGIDLAGLALWGGTRANSPDNATAGDAAFAITVRHHPEENILRERGYHLDVDVTRDLQPEEVSIWSPPKLVPTLPAQLAALARRSDVVAVRLHLDRLQVGMAAADDLRQAIMRLRAANKRVTVSLRDADDKTYYVAAAADHITMDNAGALQIDGFAVTVQYLASTLSKIGVRFDAVGIGRYKSGPDPLTRSLPRPEDAEVEGEILQHAQGALVATLAQDRHLDPKRINDIFDSAVFTASDAMAAGLVDAIVPENPPRKHQRTEDGYVPLHAAEHPSRLWGGSPKIAVVPVVGTIVLGEGDNPFPGKTAAAQTIVAQLRAAAANPSVAGIVVRIDSPGGDVYASEVLWRAIRDAGQAKPIVASMGDVAASGGYYAAVAAPYVFAQPSTITGSIGIFTLKPDISGLLDMLSLHAETYRSHPHANWDSIITPLADADRARVEHALLGFYETFVSRVAQGRHLDPALVKERAQGRVYTGARAKELRLVDAFGCLEDALQWVRTQANIAPDTQVHIVVPSRPVDLARFVRQVAFGQAFTFNDFIEETTQRLQAFDGKYLAMMPYSIEVRP